ncbi:MAG: hypothetical protein Kow00124_13270 [Anaerolineae bacterium]
MYVTEIDRHNREDVRAFLNLPFTIYRDIPQWVPPIMPGERERFKDSFAYYQRSEAAFFLVRDDRGRPVGRIAVLENRPHNEYRRHRDALLYLYEAVNDDEVAAALFEAAEGWARQRGLDCLVGPKGFLTGDGLGLLIEGFEHRPALGIPYNPDYYPRQWENHGMVKEIDYYSAFAQAEGFEYPERVRRIAEKIMERRGFRVPEFRSKAEIRRYAARIREAYNNAFVDVWAYTPIPEQELEAIVSRLILISDPRLMKIIFKDDEVVGFTFAYPDISAALQRSRGELFPFGWADILLEQRRTLWLNLNGNAVLPQYQGLGANAVLYNEMLKSLVRSRYRYADLVQVQETNTRMLSDLGEVLPLNIHKRHRVYKKRLT